MESLPGMAIDTAAVRGHEPPRCGLCVALSRIVDAATNSAICADYRPSLPVDGHSYTGTCRFGPYDAYGAGARRWVRAH